MLGVLFTLAVTVLGVAAVLYLGRIAAHIRSLKEEQFEAMYRLQKQLLQIELLARDGLAPRAAAGAREGATRA